MGASGIFWYQRAPAGRPDPRIQGAVGLWIQVLTRLPAPSVADGGRPSGGKLVR